MILTGRAGYETQGALANNQHLMNGNFSSKGLMGQSNNEIGVELRYLGVVCLNSENDVAKTHHDIPLQSN